MSSIAFDHEAKAVPSSRLRRLVQLLRHPSLICGLIVVALIGLSLASHDPGRLRLVVKSCIAAQRIAGIPFPCLDVNLGGSGQPGSIVLSTPIESHILISPTMDISGLESPELRNPGTDIYWKYAWDARHFLFKQWLPGFQARKFVGLAVNSKRSRSQDHFHIHIDCARTSLVNALEAHDTAFGDRWTVLPFPIDGQRYYGRRISVRQLQTASMIADLIADNPNLSSSLAQLSVALISAADAPPDTSFYALAGLAYAQGEGTENLLDHSCAN